jgi:hypothetical protein
MSEVPSTTDFERTSANSRLMQNGDTHGPVAMRPSLLESLTVLQPHLSPEVSSTFQRGRRSVVRLASLVVIHNLTVVQCIWIDGHFI